MPVDPCLPSEEAKEDGWNPEEWESQRGLAQGDLCGNWVRVGGMWLGEEKDGGGEQRGEVGGWRVRRGSGGIQAVAD